MFRNLSAICLTFIVLIACVPSNAQEPKKAGTIIGEVKGHQESKDRRNTMIEVLAPGEEKARSYHVNYDPKIKGPIPSVLKAVRAAKIGDRVEMEWISTNHGPAITAFKVLKTGSKDEGKDKK